MNVKWDPIKWTFVYCMHQNFKFFFFFCKYWRDDGLLRPKLVGNNRILIYLLTAIGLTTGGSSTVYIYTVAVVQYTFTQWK
jgi:hypothetical protein